MNRFRQCSIVLLFVFSTILLAEETPDQQKLQEMSPARGWLKSHQDIQRPYGLLGGPLRIRVRQQSGGVHVALPDYRRLDENVFGTPEMPLAYGGSPLIYGVPPALRETENGQYTRVTRLSPFGDKATVLRKGRFTLEAIDATATDAAVTEDSVRLEASWEDQDGNTYSVRCSQVTPHGIEYPFFGGVVTNHILHGFSRIGSPLMPTEFAYVAFWGTGSVSKNGQVTDEPVIVHGMLTELVRLDDYELAFDEEVIPTERHFHLLVPPFMPSEDKTHFVEDPVDTGFTTEDGKPLPFWHVMFNNLEIRADRLDRPARRQARGTLRTGNGLENTSGSAGQNANDEARRPQTSDGGQTAQGRLTSEPYRRNSPVIGMTNSLEYTPRRIQIPVNETVVWKNTSDLVHTVTADPQLANDPSHVQLPEGARTFNSDYLQPGQEYRYNFTVPGTYKYFCVPHEAAGMIGIVEVVSGGE